MLYTFTVTERELDRITDYIDGQWGYPDHLDRYIFSIQRSLIDDRVVIVIDCDEGTAVMVSLMITH